MSGSLGSTWATTAANHSIASFARSASNFSAWKKISWNVREWAILIYIRGRADWFFIRQKCLDPVVYLVKKTSWILKNCQEELKTASQICPWPRILILYWSFHKVHRLFFSLQALLINLFRAKSYLEKLAQKLAQHSPVYVLKMILG